MEYQVNRSCIAITTVPVDQLFRIDMDLIYITTFPNAYGELIIGDYRQQLCVLDWKYRDKREQVDTRVCSFLGTTYHEEETLLHRETIRQLNEYFERKRTSFDLPLLFAGTEFQQKVWRSLLEIPYGKTVSYLELSRRMGDEKAIRAVASANGANAISIVIPCHRVVGSKGELTGYAGSVRVKQKLLQLETSSQQPELFSGTLF